jgi:hypothetical protein
MRALLGLLALLAACTFEPGEFQEPGTGDGSGSGSGSGGSGGGGSAAVIDTDGDGLVDASDNCSAVGNVDQRDHDADGFGDVCDPCPHRLGTVADSDADGVGDACDPNPTTAGDRIAFFEGFYAAPSWTVAVGANTWMLDQGTVRQADVADAHQLVRDDDPDLKSVSIEMRVRINAVTTSASSRRSTGIVAAYHDEENFLFCGLAADGDANQVNAGQVDTDWLGYPRFRYDESEFAAPMTGDWLTVQARTIQLDEWTTRIECSTHRAGLPAPSNAVYDAEASIAGDVGVRTNGTDASFDYFFVVESPTPAP